MLPNKIKIGHHDQADEPIFLYPNGEIVCGIFKCSGKSVNKFRNTYELICDLVEKRQPDGSIDVSAFRFWTAPDLYEEYIARPWKKSIGAKKLYQLANESIIYRELQGVISVFNKVLHTKWKKEFRSSDINDPDRPTHGWHLFKKRKCE
jgi:hypothetical protein